MNSRAVLMSVIIALALIALLAGFLLKPDYFTRRATSEDGNETTLALIWDLSDRVNALEREIAEVKESAVGSIEPSFTQADVAKVLGEMSDRWMRSMSDSLESIKGELNAIRRILER